MKCAISLQEARKALAVAACFVPVDQKEYLELVVRLSSGAEGVSFEAVADPVTACKVTLPHSANCKPDDGSCIVKLDVLKRVLSVGHAKDEVALEADDVRLSLQSSTGRFAVPLSEQSLGEASTPAAASIRFTMAAGVLSGLLHRVQFAVPKNDHRRALLGIFFRVRGGRLSLTATDGKKACRIFQDVPVDSSASASAVIPPKALVRVLAYFRPAEELSLTICEKFLCIEGAGLSARIAAFEGRYPELDDVLPKFFDHGIAINRALLLNAARAAGVVADPKSRAFWLDFANGRCRVSAKSDDMGEYSTEIPSGYGDPVELSVFFNWVFLTEVLSQFRDETLTLRLRNPARPGAGVTSPAIFASEAAPDYLSLLMPIKPSDLSKSEKFPEVGE